MAYDYTYKAYWREQGATNWTEISSASPITWNQEITGNDPVNPQQGGDFNQYGGITVRYTVVLINQVRTHGAKSYSFQERTEGRETWIDIVIVNCDNQTIRDGVYVRNNRNGFVQDNRNTIQILGGAACGPGQPFNPAGEEGECITTFNTGLIITRPECIEVTTAPPECPCCKGLLPKANSILARL